MVTFINVTWEYLPLRDFVKLLELIGSGTRLHLLALLSARARSINELAKNLGVTQQAVMKHLTILERNGIVQQIKLNSKYKVRSVYTISKPLSLGYNFKNGVLCLYIGSGEYRAKATGGIEKLEAIAYSRKMLRMRTKVVTNRLRALVEEDLRRQAEIDDITKKLDLTPLQTIALQCLLGMDPDKQFDEASKTFGINLRETIKDIV